MKDQTPGAKEQRDTGDPTMLAQATRTALSTGGDRAAGDTPRLGLAMPPPATNPVEQDEPLPKTSVVDASRMYYFRLTQFNPLRELTPARVREWHEQFDRGYFYRAAQMWQKMICNDLTLLSVFQKRLMACSKQDWAIETDDKSPEAVEQKAFLEYVYSTLEVTNSYQTDITGGVSQLIRQMLTAIGFQFSAHELVWTPTETPDGMMMKLQAKFLPLWFFEGLTGRLRYVPTPGGWYGNELDPKAWLICAMDEPLMRGTAICYLFKHVCLADWLVYSGRNGMPGVIAKSDAKPGTAEWEANREALREIGQEFTALVSKDAEVEALDLAGKGAGALPYPDLIEKMERDVITAWRGADLGTRSQGAATGASLQAGEGDILLEFDAQKVSETLNAKVDRIALQWKYGPDVVIKARFQVQTPDRQEAATRRAAFALAKDLGVDASKAQFYEIFGLDRPDPDDPDDAIAPPPPTPGQPGPGPANPLDILLGGRQVLSSANAQSEPEAGASVQTFTATKEQKAAVAAALKGDFAPLANELMNTANGTINVPTLRALLQRYPQFAREVFQNPQAAQALKKILTQSANAGAAQNPEEKHHEKVA